MMPASHIRPQHPPVPNNPLAGVVQAEVGGDASSQASTTTVSPAVQDAIDRIDLIPYAAEDLEGISPRVEPEVELVSFSIVDAGPLRQVDADAIAARLRSDHEPPVELFRIEQSDLPGFSICQTIWDALPNASALKVFGATSCNFYEEETVCNLFEKLSQCEAIQDVYFRDVGQWLPESTAQLSRSIARFLRRKSDTLRLLSLACNEHVEIDLDLEQGLRSMQHRQNLQHFNMWMNALGDDRICPIVNVLALPGWKLRSVDLAENNLTAAMLPSISNLMNSCRHTLRLLRLSDNPRLLAPGEAKPTDIKDFLQTFRQCHAMHSFSIDQCGVDGPLALGVFESCVTHGNSQFHVPLRQICMQNNPSIGQDCWRRIIRDVIPRMATLKLLFVSDFEYEADMRMSFSKNMVLEWVEPAWFTSRSGLDRAVNDILARNRLRNRRYRQVQHLLQGPVALGAQTAAVRRLIRDGDAGKAGLFMILSRLAETSHTRSCYAGSTCVDQGAGDANGEGVASTVVKVGVEDMMLEARPPKRRRQIAP